MKYPNRVRKRDFRRLILLGSVLTVLFLVSATIATPAFAQNDLTGSGGSANVGVASENESLAETPPVGSPEGGASGTQPGTGSAPQSPADSTGDAKDSGGTQGSTDGTEQIASPPTGDGSEIFETTNAQTGESDAEASPVTADEGDSESDEEAETQIVAVFVYNCESDPGTGDPATSSACAPADGVVVNATIGLDVVATGSTDSAGQALLEIEDGAVVQISQEASTIKSGYMALTSSKEVTSAEGATTFLVNVRDASMGRFQVASGQCFTLDDPRVEMMVIGPMVQAAQQSCGPLGGAEFALAGGPSASSQTIVTSGAGSWTGYLEPGEYTLSRGGTSVSFSVQAGAITAVVSIDYVAGASGTLSVQRYYCTDGETAGVTIAVYPGGGGGAPNASCVLSSANVVFGYIGGQPGILDLQGGSISVEVAAGDEYYVRDVSGVTSEAFTIGEGETVQVVISEIHVVGSLSVQLYRCTDPASNFEDPSQADYWESECGAAGSGTTVTLRDAAGTVISAGQTGSTGGVSFADLVPGVYTLTTTDSCAAFAGGFDARGGFEVAAKTTSHVSLYSCQKPVVPPGGGNNSGGNNSGGNGGGSGNGTGSNGTPGGNSTGGNNEGQTGGPTQGGSESGSLGAVPAELFSIGQFQPTLLPAPKPKLYVLNLPGVGTGTKAAPDSSNALMMVMAAVLAAGVLGIAAHRVTQQPARVRSRR
ncbi:MAG: hypothetical protein KF883_15510 [Thermomicrobiales bacterium]|nr:hypothetical protein [Thermomicrobiales bacterium]